MHSAIKKWIKSCHVCQVKKGKAKIGRFPLKNIVTSYFNELVQIDHQKICRTESGHNGILVMIDHYTKLAEAIPCVDYTAEETCNILLNHWISRYGTPTFIQSDNGVQLAAHMTQEFLRQASVSQVFSTTYHPRTNGLVERQNRTLIMHLRVYCSRYMKDWDFYLPQVVGA